MNNLCQWIIIQETPNKRKQCNHKFNYIILHEPTITEINRKQYPLYRNCLLCKQIEKLEVFDDVIYDDNDNNDNIFLSCYDLEYM